MRRHGRNRTSAKARDGIAEGFPAGTTISYTETLVQLGSLSIANGAELFGPGTIVGSVTNNGTVTVNVENGVGTLTAFFGFTQNRGGVLNMKVATGFGGLGIVNDQLSSPLGPVTLGGTLNVSAVAGFTPIRGQTFDLVRGARLVGRFATVNLPALPKPLRWVAVYDPGRGKLVLRIV